MKSKRLAVISGIGTCLTAIAVAVSCFGNNDANGSRYNLQPDTSGKIIASINAPPDRVIPQVLGDVLYESTCVIIGEVIDYEVVSWERASVAGFKSTMYYTIASIKVIETITGESPFGGTILYRQVGSPEAPWHTQVKVGETCVFMLRYLESVDQYGPTLFEESVWYINGKNKLTSMSDRLFCAKYDGVDLGILIEDIHELQAKRPQWFMNSN